MHSNYAKVYLTCEINSRVSVAIEIILVEYNTRTLTIKSKVSMFLSHLRSIIISTLLTLITGSKKFIIELVREWFSNLDHKK